MPFADVISLESPDESVDEADWLWGAGRQWWKRVDEDIVDIDYEPEERLRKGERVVT